MKKTLVFLCAVTASLAYVFAEGETGKDKTVEPLVITEDTVLEKGAVIDRPIVIKAGNITIDGNGATVKGPGKAGEPGSFQGNGITADGCSNVTLKNIKVNGYRVGLTVSNAESWCIEDCDFSDNYTDPEVGWGDNEDFGGIVLTKVCKSTIRRNTAQRVWNGLDLIKCDDNTITKNNFSHCSNVCLSMWRSCRNVVEDNVLSYGLRIRTGEVHARDSACALIMCGSNNNRFERNDLTHGGDGIFVRCLNGWESIDNVFTENDCSYANNNCIECVAPRNTFIRNKANHGSYGFWLGGAAEIVMIENEIGHNGDPEGFHNAPLLGIGNAGVAMINIYAGHVVMTGNYVHDNNGPGVILYGDYDNKGRNWKAYHWIIQKNRFEKNKWAIRAEYADWIFISGNSYKDNEEKDYINDVARLSVSTDPIPDDAVMPTAVIECPEVVKVGQKVTFDASKSSDPAGAKLKFMWDIAGEQAEGPKFERSFDKPGFQQVSLVVSNGQLANLATRSFYVVDDAEEIGTEGDAAKWQFEFIRKGNVVYSDCPGICGKKAIQMRVDPYPGDVVEFLYPAGRKDQTWNFAGKKRMVFWVRYRVDSHWGFGGPYPIIRLHGRSGQIVFVPKYRVYQGLASYTGDNWGWRRVIVDLDGSDKWEKQEKDTISLESIDRIGIVIQKSWWPDEPFTIWLDGLTFE